MDNKNTLIKRVRRLEYVSLTLILLLSVFTRLYKIGNPVADWHSFRQADTASVSRIYVSEGINLLYPRYYDISTTQSGLFNPRGYRFVEFPIYNAVHAFAASNFRFLSFELWGRLTSIIFALGSAVILFYLGRKFISKWHRHLKQ